MGTIAIGPTLDVSFLADHYFESDAVLDDGSFALSGTTTIVPPGTDGYPQFEVQAYGADGAMMGHPFVPEAGNPADTGGLIPFGDHYFVSWQHFLAKISAAAFIDREGESLTSAFSWPNSDIEAYDAYYRHGGSPTYHFLPIMYHQDGAYPDGTPFLQPLIEVYGPDAKPLGGPVALGIGPSRIYVHSMAINGKGRFVVLIERCPATFDPPGPCTEGVQVFSGTGHAETAFLTRWVVPVESALGSLSGDVTVGIEPGGKFLFLWSIKTAANAFTLFARLFDPLGTPLSGPLPIAQTASEGFSEEQIRGLTDGSFALSWAVSELDGQGSLYVSRFDPSTLQASPPMLIVTDRFAAEAHHLELNDSGHGIVTWSTYHPENPDHVFAGFVKLITFRPFRKPKPPTHKQRP